MPLKPDVSYEIGELKVKEFLLTKHNESQIDMPTVEIYNKPCGITVYSMNKIIKANNTTPAEQFTRATINNRMGDFRIHFYVDNYCAWQLLPLNLSGWHCGDRDGNQKTISVAIIGSDKAAELNGVKLIIQLLDEYGLSADNLYTPFYWDNKRKGIQGTVDFLNTAWRERNVSPFYFEAHWLYFKRLVAKGLTLKNGFSENLIEKELSSNSQIELSYSKKKETGSILKKQQKEIDVFYQVYCNKQWLPEVKNLEDEAGLKGYAISCLTARSSQGLLSYRVHQKGSYWMKWISANDPCHINGYAGICGIKIDALQMKLTGLPNYNVKYRVAPIGKDYGQWIIGSEKFAGIIGQKIERIQIEIIRKDKEKNG